MIILGAWLRCPSCLFGFFHHLCRLAKNLKVDGAEGRSCYTMFYLSLIENWFSHLYLPALQLLYPVLANPNYIRKWKFGWRVMTSNAADSAFAQLVTVNGRCWARTCWGAWHECYAFGSVNRNIMKVCAQLYPIMAYIVMIESLTNYTHRMYSTYK